MDTYKFTYIPKSKFPQLRWITPNNTDVLYSQLIRKQDGFDNSILIFLSDIIIGF